MDELWVESNDFVRRIGDREYRDCDVTVKQEWIDMIRSGYMCVSCFERFQHAWPETCSMCGFPVADRQSEAFARQYGGTDEFERWEPTPSETEQRASKSGIWVPRGV